MRERSVYQLFDSAVKKCQELTADPLKECKKKVLSQFTIKAKNYLDKWVVEIEESSVYSIMNRLGLTDNTYFYKEYPVLGFLGLGDFYKKIEVKDDTVIHVKKIKDFEDEEIERILKALEEGISKKGVQKLVAPFGFFVFQFQALYRMEKPLKETKGEVKTLIVKAGILHNAKIEFKKALEEMTQNFLKDFMVFHEGRWRILKTKSNGGWLRKGYILITSFREVS